MWITDLANQASWWVLVENLAPPPRPNMVTSGFQTQGFKTVAHKPMCDITAATSTSFTLSMAENMFRLESVCCYGDDVCLHLSYLRVVTVVMEIVGVGSVGAPVTRLLEHFLGFGCHPRLALGHATLWRSGTHTYTQVRELKNWLQLKKFTADLQSYDIFDESRRWYNEKI